MSLEVVSYCSKGSNFLVTFLAFDQRSVKTAKHFGDRSNNSVDTSTYREHVSVFCQLPFTLPIPSIQPRPGAAALSHSRSSSNLGDDADRDGDWDDDEPGSGGPGGGLSGDGFGGLHIQTAIGAPSPLSLGGPSPSLHSHSPSLHAHSPSPQPPSPSEEWRRWAETEVNKERRRVDKLVGVIRTFDVNLEAQAQSRAERP